MNNGSEMPAAALANGDAAEEPVLGHLVSGRAAHAVRGSKPAPLPFGAAGFAVSRPPGSTRLLILLPPGVRLRVGESEWLHTAALVEHGQALTLMAGEPFAQVAPDGAPGSGAAPVAGGERSAALVFRALASLVPAGDAHAARCGMCFAPLARSDRVRVCPACRAVLCIECASGGQCIACGETLGGGGA